MSVTRNKAGESRRPHFTEWQRWHRLAALFDISSSRSRFKECNGHHQPPLDRSSPRKRILLIWALVVAVSSLALGQTKGKQADQNKVGSNSQAEQEIMKLENELVKAGLQGDAAATDRLMAGLLLYDSR
jgi:hypothetical protein